MFKFSFRMLHMYNKANEEEIDDSDFFFKIPPIFEVSAWLQSLNSSVNTIDTTSNKEQTYVYTKPFLIKKWEIMKINMNSNLNFNKQGLLTKCSIIRIMFWYQKIMEQMFFLFKKRMNKLIQEKSINIEIIQGELDSFIISLNDLTTKCEKRIENCLNSNLPDHIKNFQPLTQEQKYKLIDILIESFNISDHPSFNCEIISKELGIDQKRVENFMFLKRNEIKKYLFGKGELPKWIIQKYSQQLNLIKQNAIEMKS